MAGFEVFPGGRSWVFGDNVGVEHIGAYGIGTDLDFADTTELNDWLQTWIRSEEAWATPICSPTRATIQTGRFGHHTGVGSLVQVDSDWGLDPDTSPYVLAKLLGNKTDEEEDLYVPVAYTTAMFGKYHLGTSPGPAECELLEDDCVPYQGGPDSPSVAGGFDDYKVHHQDLQQDLDHRYIHYWTSTPTEPEVEVIVNQQNLDDYLTRATFDWFIDWCNTNDCRNQSASATPWYAYIAPWAAHAPLHCPPSNLEGYGDIACTLGNNKSMYYAMIRSLSIEIDRVLRYLTGGHVQDPQNTLIIVASDNGSPGNLSEEPFDFARAKGSVNEGGVRVPLWIGGEDVTVSGEVAIGDDPYHFVQLLDLYPTILEVAGLCDQQNGCPTELGTDGVSLTRYFTNLSPSEAAREFGYVEWFYPSFNPDPMEAEGPAVGQWAVRNGTHKWVKRTTGETALYRLAGDLADGEAENTNLLSATPPLDEEDQDAYDAILAYYATLGFSTQGLLSLCALEQVGEECTDDVQCCSQMCVQASPPPDDASCQLPDQFE